MGEGEIPKGGDALGISPPFERGANVLGGGGESPVTPVYTIKVSVITGGVLNG
jgi:hypothetical protein